MTQNDANNTSDATQYPPDALTAANELDVINTHDAQTLDQVFRERVRRSADKIAFTQFDSEKQQWQGLSWAEMASQVERWQVAFRDSGLVKGDRVAICHKNSIEWVLFDQAALRLGLVVVPLYTSDRADNMAYVLEHSGAKLVVLSDSNSWQNVLDTDADLSCVETRLAFKGGDQELTLVSDWLPEQGQHLQRGMAEPDDLASIVYTSGTTGRPKGVMLSHKNLLSNAYASLRSVAVKPSDQLLSVLPLSHALERTAGYYAAMLSGASITFSRSISELANDLKIVKPTMMVAVPRIFERVQSQIRNSVSSMSTLKRWLFEAAIRVGWHKFEYQQGRAKWHTRLLFSGLLDGVIAKPIRARLGGQLTHVIVGGAPLSADVSKTFIALGLPLLQGYGLSEASPVVSVNTPEHNRPDSIGLPLRGVRVKIADHKELWIKGENVMQAYWQNPEATRESIVEDDSGRWLRTGDCASIDHKGYIKIIGRIKDIMVMDNGEKLAPFDVEAAILAQPLFDQVMVVGEGRPFLSALVVLNQDLLRAHIDRQGWSEREYEGKLKRYLLAEIAKQIEAFPGYVRVRRVVICNDEWTIDSGLLTPTLKIKRAAVLNQYQEEIDVLYAERKSAASAQK